MRDKKKIKVYVFGFAERPGWWPKELEFTPLSQKPRAGWLPDAPILVHINVVRDYIPLALRISKFHPSGRLPEAILYKPRDVKEPVDTAPYFDDVICEGEEERLLRLLSCPLTLTIGEWADADYVPDEIREHLRNCDNCRDVFEKHMRDVYWLYQLLQKRSPRQRINNEHVH